MRKKWIYSISVVLVLSLVVEVQAVATHWSGAGPDSLFSTPENWNPQAVPTAADDMFVDQPDGTYCVVPAGVDGQCGTLRVGNSVFTTNLDIAGGSFTVTGGCYIGVDNASGHGILNVSGGLFTSADMNLGLRGTGTLNMTGGIVQLGWDLKIPGNSGTGKANLNGGTLKALNLDLTSALGSMDITAGTMILEGDDSAALQVYIDDGRLTGYDGQGTLHVDYDVTHPGKTTVTASHPLNPIPADGITIPAGNIELAWTLPEALIPGLPVLVDVYFTDNLELLKSFSDPAAIQIVSKQNVTSVAMQTQAKVQYYWAIDTYISSPDNPVFGPIFSFFADNIPPHVDAGDDAVTWLADGVRTKNLNAIVTDDEAFTVQWTVVSEPDDPDSPDAVITDPIAENTSIVLSALGEYVLRLEAFDGEYTGSDTVTINVYTDGCEAAQSLPDYEPFPGDLNGDCTVDDLDLAILQEDWLKDNSLTEP